MILFTNFLITFMVLIGGPFLNTPVAAATNISDLDGGSTLITMTKTSATTSAPTPSPTFTFICPIDNCADIYNKCIVEPNGLNEHYPCMPCCTYAFKVCCWGSTRWKRMS